MTIVLDFGNDLPREVDFTNAGGSRVIDVETLPGRSGPAGPRGQAGPGSDELLARAMSTRAALPAQAALASGTLRVVMAGDSKIEGTGIKQLLQRSINQLATMLRGRYVIAGGDQGIGHIPVRFWTAWEDDLADRRPTLTNIPAANQIGYQGGPGNRAVQMDTAGAKVTFKAESFRYATVSFTQDAGAAGVFTVVVDGTVRATINTAPPQDVTVREARQRVDLGSVASRVVELRWVSGTPRVGGILFQTSLTGITVEDHAHSGFNARHLAEGFVENGAPFSDDRLFEQIALAAPQLVILGLGANDQGTYSEDTWRDYLKTIVAKAKAAAPGAGIVLLHGAQRTDDVATDPGRLVRFEAAARAAIGDDPQVSIVYESLLWAPRPGTDYAWGGPEGWLLDTVHPSVLGHRRIAEALMALITAGQAPAGPQGPAGTSTLANITDASTLGRQVGAAPTAADVRALLGVAGDGAGLLQGQEINSLITPGGYIQGSSAGTTVANGYPIDGFAGAIDVSATSSGSMVFQVATYFQVGGSNEGRWYRTRFGAPGWSPWRRITTYITGSGSPEGSVIAAPGARYLDTSAATGALEWIKAAGLATTGWRVSNGDTGWRRIPLEAGFEIASAAATCDIRRINETVHLRVRGQVAADAAFIGTTRTARRPFLTLPAGFIAATYGALTAAEVANGIGIGSTAGSNSRIDVVGPSGNWAVGDGVWFQASWATTAVWPTTLPGTPS